MDDPQIHILKTGKINGTLFSIFQPGVEAELAE